MRGISLESLPLGFRFRPTDEELISHYLRHKINGNDSAVQIIREVDVCKCEPWDLPGLSVIKGDDPEWFFFCPRDRKYPNGHRSNRATDAGYWKATGKDRTIKSRRKGTSEPLLIGMKKTLVFHRGRAPKGERTSWIMHEYRATEEDLDGSSPGQGAFVLCRLFKKSDKKEDHSKYDEVEQTGLSSSTNKSSPDDMSPDAIQETTGSYVHARKQQERTWRSDDLTSNGHFCPGGCSSDADNHSAEEATTEVHPQPEGHLVFEESTCEQVDCKVFSPGPMPMDTVMGLPFDVLFEDDFGIDYNGTQFWDGTGEQDAYFSELLKLCQNHVDCPCEESTIVTTSAVCNDTKMVGPTPLLAHGLPGNSYMKHSEIYHDMALEQKQTFPTYCLAETTSYAPKHGMEDIGALPDDAMRQNVSSADSVIAPFYGSLKNLEASNGQTSVANCECEVGETGIKIRTRQPGNRLRAKDDVTQGNAPRRIRLLAPVSASSNKLGDSSSCVDDEGHEAQSSSEAREVSIVSDEVDSSHPSVADHNCKTWSRVNRETSQVSNAREKVRTEQDGETGCCQVMSPSFSGIQPLLSRRNISMLHAVGICLVAILFMVYIGMWRCPTIVLS